ncbi:YveK family protein [Halothermothrix orenii]|uniref:Lipopolysaccharide biosynthesis protein n=1 Tax=Halothermothrix orenii (strain H 168 / OCM 544 / DSM 9562) TaxID=373903 RepID=B8D183_HALOH|nr:Wzz/FepE/Etk N-terminal domain-containing protein [Halothermothrix orenii]ACL71035.1 lipopolysaccharide biosynthesis protein [Halothermothrix orenii H 168]
MGLLEEVRYYEEYEIDLREYIKVLWAGRWLVISLMGIAILLVGLASYFLINPVYETEAVIRLTSTDGIYSRPASMARLIKSPSLLKGVMEGVNREYTMSELHTFASNNIKVNHVRETSMLEIKVSHTEPRLAFDILEGLIVKAQEKSDKYYRKVVNHKETYLQGIITELDEINQRIGSVEEGIEKLNNRDLPAVEKYVLLNSLDNNLDSLLTYKRGLVKDKNRLERELLTLRPLEVISSPYVPENPVSPNIKLNVVIAGILGLMMGVFIVFFREFMKE